MPRALHELAARAAGGFRTERVFVKTPSSKIDSAAQKEKSPVRIAAPGSRLQAEGLRQSRAAPSMASAIIAGNAAHQAALAARRQIFETAAEMLGVNPEELVAHDGKIETAGEHGGRGAEEQGSKENNLKSTPDGTVQNLKSDLLPAASATSMSKSFCPTPLFLSWA